MAATIGVSSTSLHINHWPTDLASFTDRDVTWCYNFFMPQPSNISIHEKENGLLGCFNYQMSNRIGIGFNNIFQPFSYNMVVGLKQGNVIDLSWIDKKDGRLLNWVMAYGLFYLTTIQPPVNIGYNGMLSAFGYPFLSLNSTIFIEQQHSFIIEYLDSIRFCYTDANYKQSWFNTLKDYWLKVKTPVADMKWLDQGNQEQLVWAWQYLQDKSKAASLPPPANSREYYNAILASMDGMTLLDNLGQPTAEKQLFIANFKKAWSQKKFRAEGKTKKPYHLPLTKKSKAALETLAQVRNQSENEVLESLINEAYVNTCLDATGKAKY